MEAKCMYNLVLLVLPILVSTENDFLYFKYQTLEDFYSIGLLTL